jgi:hypothetical protein
MNVGGKQPMPCRCREGLERWREGLKELRESDKGGLERLFYFGLYWLRLVSISEWLSFCITGGRENAADHATDRNIVDCYVVTKTVLVAVLLIIVPAKHSLLTWFVQLFVWYLLAEMYLSLLNVVFVGTLKQDRKISVGRSLLLLMFNAAQLVLSFAVFYRVSLHKGIRDAVYTSVEVFSTLGVPKDARTLVTLQVALSFIFLTILLAKFLGMDEKPGQTKRPKQPKR